MALAEQSFALWLHYDHGRLAAGDLAFITGGRQPRPRDIVVALTMDQSTIAEIGNLTELSDTQAVITDGGKERSINRRSHVLLKVACVRYA